MEPLVSICVPTYNPDLSYLHELMASIERQTWSRIEVVLSDDSSANFDEMVSTLPPSKYQRKVVRGDARLGMARNWNHSANAASGRYVMVVGQDDLIAEDGVESLVVAAEKHQVDIVFGGQGYINASGEVVKNPSKSVARTTILHDSETKLHPQTAQTLALVYGNVLGDPCSTLIRKTLFDASGGFSDRYLHAADLEFWMRLASMGNDSVCLKKVVAFHRSHAANATTSHVGGGVAQADRLQIHTDFGSVITDDMIWNRSVIRLRLHALYDKLRYQIGPAGAHPPMRGSYSSRLLALLSEFAELTKIKHPMGKRYTRHGA